ncbi:hypothetical protein MCOR02_009822 [Pyricularia oryzae]|nr:hypothetical protein MCOR01_001353 [Pyricularia oryzae]KAH9430104.1 hypothetical protein MCOR02_009822 [Pyricularia oryzae]KAI6258618.1 hypothetical protein MCOR19_005000 [Pyricularia oryzae]KAI6426769.1 hypothetical protein MCOR21_006498 [Pyricularia oryzae]KAI6484562.1 hypothetical protein MCOR11_010046 [Pyricularia oryzae]
MFRSPAASTSSSTLPIPLDKVTHGFRVLGPLTSTRNRGIVETSQQQDFPRVEASCCEKTNKSRKPDLKSVRLDHSRPTTLYHITTTTRFTNRDPHTRQRIDHIRSSASLAET